MFNKSKLSHISVSSIQSASTLLTGCLSKQLGKINDQSLTYPVGLWIIKEIGPVGIRLHVSELEELPQTQGQDILADLSINKKCYDTCTGLL